MREFCAHFTCKQQRRRLKWDYFGSEGVVYTVRKRLVLKYFDTLARLARICSTRTVRAQCKITSLGAFMQLGSRISAKCCSVNFIMKHLFYSV